MGYMLPEGAVDGSPYDFTPFYLFNFAPNSSTRNLMTANLALGHCSTVYGSSKYSGSK